jgi:hypothetical protein
MGKRGMQPRKLGRKWENIEMERYDGMVWIGLIWFGIGTGGV